MHNELNKKLDFLEKNIFLSLKNINDGFDSKSIYYFSESDFEIILKRVESYGLGIYGIEPWFEGDFYGVLACEDYNQSPSDSRWYKKAFSKFKNKKKNLQYSATYQIPKKLLK